MALHDLRKRNAPEGSVMPLPNDIFYLMRWRSHNSVKCTNDAERHQRTRASSEVQEGRKDISNTDIAQPFKTMHRRLKQSAQASQRAASAKGRKQRKAVKRAVTIEEARKQRAEAIPRRNAGDSAHFGDTVYVHLGNSVTTHTKRNEPLRHCKVVQEFKNGKLRVLVKATGKRVIIERWRITSVGLR